MSGTVGLTPAGQMLDFALTDLDDGDKRHVVKFIQSVTRMAAKLRTELDAETSQTVLNIVREHYRDQVDDKFDYLDDTYGSTVGRMIRGLIESYICAVCKRGFIGDTKTQRALARKRAMAAASAAPAATN